MRIRSLIHNQKVNGILERLISAASFASDVSGEVSSGVSGQPRSNNQGRSFQASRKSNWFETCVQLAVVPALVAIAYGTVCPSATWAQTVVLEFYDDETGEPVSARFQWAPQSRKVTKPRTLLSQGNWWLASPDFSLTPKARDYEFIVERGPEFTDISGGFTMDRQSRDVVVVEIPRSTYMRSEKWYSADHSVSLPQEQAIRWQRADAVDLISIPQEHATKSSGGVAPDNVAKPPTDAEDEAITPAKKSSQKRSSKEPAYEKLVETINKDIVGEQLQVFHRTYNLKNGRFRVHGLSPTLGHAGADKRSVSPSADATPGVADISSTAKPIPESFSDAMRDLQSLEVGQGTWVELVDPWARDVPILLSTGRVDAVQLLSNSSRPVSDEAMAVRPPQDPTPFPFAKIQRSYTSGRTTHFVFAPFKSEDRILFKGPQGTAKLGEMAYWQMLESGLKLTATAGTDFGLADTYLGYNRTYFYNPVPPTPQNWVDAIRNGEVVVTNGPLLRPMLNGHPPGSTHPIDSEEGLPLNFEVSLTVRERVDYLDVISNGETIYSAKLEDHYKNGEFPPLKVKESGWCVLRIVTNHEKGYRVAATSPFYFQLNGTARISKRAVEFMISWLDNSAADIKAKGEWSDYEPWIQQAEAFWRNRLTQANAP